MGNLNKVMLIGNLTRDVEVRAIPSGAEVAKFSLAINRTWMSQDGQKNEETTFVDCELWGKRVGPLARYTSKGDPLFVEGRLKVDTWEDRNGGGKRSKMLVAVENFEFIGGGRRSGGGGDDRGATVEVSGRGEAAPVAPDDIPF